MIKISYTVYWSYVKPDIARKAQQQTLQHTDQQIRNQHIAESEAQRSLIVRRYDLVRMMFNGTSTQISHIVTGWRTVSSPLPILARLNGFWLYAIAACS